MAKSKSAPNKKSAKVDCLGMGIMPLDLLFGVSRYPVAGEKIDGLSLTIQGGGPVPNTLIGLTRLGCKTSIIVAVGKDILGELSVSEIERENVDTTHLAFKRTSSAVAAGFVEQKSGRRTLVLNRKVFVTPADLNLAKLPIPRILHLDGRDLEATIKLAKWGKKIGALVSFDIGSIRNDVSPVFPFVDHLVVADSYAYPFTKTADTKKAIMYLAKYGPAVVVITEGTKGQIGFESGEFYRQKAYRVDTVDTTGAGDAFHTGYLYGLLNGMEMSQRLKFGSAVAAMNCTKMGARAGMPKLNDVKKYLERNPKTYD